MLNGIRRIVSGNRKRLVIEDFDLDLSYVNERIIATSYPSNGIEGLYRNTYDEVKRFLDARHNKHYKIYNLRSEKRYANDVFDNTAEFIFKDHHAPTLITVIEFCEDASHYLLQHPLNIVVVHCKAGKGRTGLMISALLLKLQVAKDPMEAMQIYADRRTHDGSGITIPSQRRYVFYYDTFLHKSGRVEDRTIEIKKIVLIGRQNAMGQNDNCMICVTLPDKPETRWFTLSPNVISTKEMELELDERLVLRNDFAIALWRTTQIGYKTKLFAFSLHTRYVTEDLILEKSELDTAANDKKCALFEDKFKIKLYSAEIQ